MKNPNWQKKQTKEPTHTPPQVITVGIDESLPMTISKLERMGASYSMARGPKGTWIITVNGCEDTFAKRRGETFTPHAFYRGRTLY